MEKIAFTLEGGESAWFYVLEQTKLGGVRYILVTEEEEGDCDALILKELSDAKDAESVFEIVEDDTELSAVAAVFENLLDDVQLT
ncbi:MAG: DUF1292 domain-containing protein [Lachnospiraceae bacterium]|nr:DUF1292 domain-containing protein [Lachnospiraceae bacterium]